MAAPIFGCARRYLGGFGHSAAVVGRGLPASQPRTAIGIFDTLTDRARHDKLNQMVEYRDEPLDALYGALSHPVRRELIDRLQPRGATVTQLARPFEMSLAAVSKHIGILEGAGLLTRTIHGREHHLALEPRSLLPAAEWLDTYRRFWETRLDLLDARIRDSRR